jgi:hypothetical protein
MAQNSIIITKWGTGSNASPTTLRTGELAINIEDGRLYYGSASIVKTITASYAITASFALNGGGGGGGGTPGGSVNEFQYNAGGGNFGGASSLTYVSATQIKASGSFTGSFVGNLTGTASYVSGNIFTNSNPALSASYALTASYVNPLNQTVILTGSLLATQSFISTVDYVDWTILTTAQAPTHNEGRVHWSDDAKTLEIDTDVNNFMIEVGHVNVVRVTNQTGAPLAAGKVVYISGSQGNRPKVVTASWDGDTTSATTLGFVAQTINDNNNGYVVTSGLLRNINTNAYPVGTQLYLSSSGDWTSTVPVSPKHEVRLGKVITQNTTTGIIYVDIMNGYELGELHNVLITTPTNGQSLVYSSSLWVNGTPISASHAQTASNGLPPGTSGQILQIDTSNQYQLQTQLKDSAGTTSVDFEGRVLRDTVFTRSVDYEARLLMDTVQGTSVDYQNRILHYPDGTTPALTYGVQDRIDITGSLFVSGAAESGGSGHVLTYNTASGLFTYTASSAIGGGGSATPTGSLLITASANKDTITFTKGDNSTFPITIVPFVIATASFTASVTPTTFTITSASITELSVTGTGITIGNALTDTHKITGSLAITGSTLGGGSGHVLTYNTSSGLIFFTASSAIGSGGGGGGGNSIGELTGDVTAGPASSPAESLAATLKPNLKSGSFGITVDGAGGVISTGQKGYVTMPYSGSILSWTLLGDQAGSCNIDITKSTYSGFPTQTSITGSAPITSTSAQKATSATLTGWTSSFDVGDVFGFNIVSLSGYTRFNLFISTVKF